jgi:hypothetical protein
MRTLYFDLKKRMSYEVELSELQCGCVLVLDVHTTELLDIKLCPLHVHEVVVQEALNTPEGKSRVGKKHES